VRRIETIAVGDGRTRVYCHAYEVGRDLLVVLGGEGIHIGAASLAQRSAGGGTSSSRLVARLDDGSERRHKEGELTDRVAARLTDATGRLTLVVSGIHVDRIGRDEIEQIRTNVEELATSLVERLTHRRWR